MIIIKNLALISIIIILERVLYDIYNNSQILYIIFKIAQKQ
ncbi:hypothetical protein pb186bvf_010465 [Paramecium bursaria]